MLISDSTHYDENLKKLRKEHDARLSGKDAEIEGLRAAIK